MRSIISAAVAICALITSTTSAPTSDVSAQEVFINDDTAGIIGTFTDAHCSQGQRDDSGAVSSGERKGACRELPGQSMKIWWVKKNCYVLLFRDRQCQGQPDAESTPGACVSISEFNAWLPYCS